MDPAAINRLRSAFGNKVSIITHDPISPQIKRIPPTPKRFVPSVAKSLPGRPGANTTATTTPTRLLDSQPYYGGDRVGIENSSGQVDAECTVAWDYQISGKYYMASAGHCATGGQTVLQGYENSAKQFVYTGTMGVVANVQFGNNRIDGLILANSSYFPAIYTSTSGARAVTGTTPVAPTSSICADGSFTGDSCGGIVQHVNECVHENDQGVTYNICGLDEATSSHRLIQPGDSGGPVLSNIPDGSVHVSGLISGGNTAGTDLLFTDIVRFEGAFGGAPAHG